MLRVGGGGAFSVVERRAAEEPDDEVEKKLQPDVDVDDREGKQVFSGGHVDSGLAAGREVLLRRQRWPRDESQAWR